MGGKKWWMSRISRSQNHRRSRRRTRSLSPTIHGHKLPTRRSSSRLVSAGASTAPCPVRWMSRTARWSGSDRSTSIPEYDPAAFNAWKIEKNGKTFEPLMKSAPSPWSLAYKKRTYSPNRIKYPLKRVDWDPNGERNPQNRGKSKYVRISWDEATRPHRRRDQAHPQAHTVRCPSWCRATATASASSSTPLTAAPPFSSTRWAASPSRCATRTAGRAGTGAPGTSGARVWWA